MVPKKKKKLWSFSFVAKYSLYCFKFECLTHMFSASSCVTLGTGERSWTRVAFSPVSSCRQRQTETVVKDCDVNVSRI